MPNKHFCQGPNKHCHETVTQDRFLKSRGVIRGRYAYCNMTIKIGIRTQINIFVVNHVSFMVIINMENIEQGRPIEFIRHRRESQGYAKVKNEERWGAEYSIQRVDNGQLIE